MPLRFFSRTSPKKTASSKENHGDGFEHAGKDFSRPPLFPLPEAAFNTFQADLTPGTAASWLSSSAQPDLQFFESQENFASLSPDKSLFPPSSVMSNPKLRLGCKESKLRLPGSHDAEYVASLHSSASSGSLQDNLFGNPDRSTYTTPRAYSNDSDSGSVTGTPVARSLKYNQSASSNSGAGSALPSTAIVPTATTPNVNAAVPISSTQPQFEIEEDPSFWKDHNVQVVIRLRPLNSWELATQGHSTCIRQDSAHELTWTGHPESRFTFDLVACETITQEKMFKVAGLPMVDNCMAGYNSCMFAYGQTGSGKTYTMLGDLEGADQRPSKNRGMTTRVFEYLFARIDKEEEARKNECLKFVCRCSFLEIYNEQILDLLEPTTTNLQMREDAKKGVYVENLSEVEARNVQDVIRLLLQGAANRKVASTNMNRESSRSHSVFTCVIESKWTSQSVTNSRFGRLNLVDLAGSERQKSSGAEGERLKEAANINKSLSTLGLVIMSLVDIANGKQRHVPYRDSKLTFLLHDSLGGNSKTTIIANISPSNCCAMETLSTLKFAQRAKFIRNNATINENASGDVMALRLQIQQLKQEVNTLRLQIVGGPISQGGIELLQQSIIGSDRNGSEFFNINNIGHSAYSLEAWDSLKAFASPTFNSKKKKELELAFVGSLRREHAGEARIRQLSAEIEHFKRLLKQREEDSQCSKMTIRFREDKIKRLESFLGGLISSDTYIMEEKNSLLEEVQILRTRLERNPEVTRFAMENIRLLEELRRFKDFYEAGERDTMAEEIAILRDQLLEALDWKLMHEQDPDALGRDKGADHSALKEENELLQMEVERFQREVEFLRNNLSSCLDVKEKLERRIDELQVQIDRSNDLGAAFLKEAGDLEPLVLASDNFETVQLKLEKQIETVEAVASTQADLIAMREAVAATSAGEHEARERVCKLEGEIEILQNDLQELREVYECALLEKDTLIKQLTEAKDIASKKVGVMQRLCPKESNQNGSNEQKDGSAELYGYEKNLTERAVSHDLTTSEERMCEEAESQKPLFSKENRTGAWDDHEIKEVGLAKNKLVDEDSRADLLLVAMEKKDMEMHELRTALDAAQRDLEKMKLQRVEELFVDKPTGMCQDAEAKMEKKHMEMHESRTVLTEELFVDKPSERTCQDAQRDREKIKLQRAEELCVGKPTDSMCQDADSHRDMLSVCLEEQYLLLQKLEKRAMGIMQHFKGEIEELDHVLQKMNMKELEEGKGSFMVLIDAIATEVALLEPAIDAKEMCLHCLRAQLENTETKLKEAEQARDDVCLLSTLERQSWMEDKTMLQQKLENALELLSCKDNMVNEALLAARANLDLLEAKLSTFSMLNDRNMVLVSNESEITMKTIMETSLEVLKVEKEVKLLEESLCVVQRKLAKADNKMNALRNILLGFSSAKEAWVIREERMQEHLQSLGGILAEKERELAILHAEEEDITNCLNELVQEEELVLLEAATLKEKLRTAEESRLKDADSIIGLNGMVQASVSMLQLLRGQEEKVTLLSVLDDAREKLKRIRVDIEDLRGQRDKKDTATLCAQVELEVITTTLQEAKIEMEEIQKEKMVLVETEAEGTSELESIVSEREKAESEVREIEEQLKVFQSHLKRLEEKLSQEGHSKCVKETLVTDLDGKILVDRIAECLSLLLDVKHNLFKREHLEC